MKKLHLRRTFLALPLLLLAFIPAHNHVAAANAGIFTRPKQVYLALGDSLAFGYQEYKFNAAVAATGTVNPAGFTTGYVNDFSALIETLRPELRTVNYGCPGETTTTFISGGCPYPFPLHDAYAGSQLAAAVAFLTAHPSVSPITLDLGANDLLGLVNGCGGVTQTTCIYAGAPAVLQTVALNLSKILATLRSVAPRSEIIVLQLYNPLAVVDTSTNSLTEALNTEIAAVAASASARSADAFTPFNLAPSEPQTLCALTLFCTSLHDIHPTDAGYQVIAWQFWTASGYDTLNSGEPDPEEGT